MPNDSSSDKSTLTSTKTNISPFLIAQKSDTSSNQNKSHDEKNLVSKTPIISTTTTTTVSDEPKHVKDLNDFISCFLCKGYLIDATTIIECLHSFCKTCILKYFDDDNNPKSRSCPKCDTQVHKTKPKLNIRSDPTLQDIVYKLVPGLFKNEMSRRKEFYLRFPDKAVGLSNEEKGEINGERLILSNDDIIQITIEYFPEVSNPYKLLPFNNDENLSIKLTNLNQRRYLLCKAGMRVLHLKKFIRSKYELDTTVQVDFFYKHELLKDDYTIMDLAYIYSWRRNIPIPLYYLILEPDKTRDDYMWLFQQTKLSPLIQSRKSLRQTRLRMSLNDVNNSTNHRVSSKSSSLVATTNGKNDNKSKNENPSKFSPKISSTPLLSKSSNNSKTLNNYNSLKPMIFSSTSSTMISTPSKSAVVDISTNSKNNDTKQANGAKRPNENDLGLSSNFFAKKLKPCQNSSDIKTSESTATQSFNNNNYINKKNSTETVTKQDEQTKQVSSNNNNNSNINNNKKPPNLSASSTVTITINKPPSVTTATSKPLITTENNKLSLTTTTVKQKQDSSSSRSSSPLTDAFLNKLLKKVEEKVSQMANGGGTSSLKSETSKSESSTNMANSNNDDDDKPPPLKPPTFTNSVNSENLKSQPNQTSSSGILFSTLTINKNSTKVVDNNLNNNNGSSSSILIKESSSNKNLVEIKSNTTTTTTAQQINIHTNGVEKKTMIDVPNSKLDSNNVIIDNNMAITSLKSNDTNSANTTTTITINSNKNNSSNISDNNKLLPTTSATTSLLNTILNGNHHYSSSHSKNFQDFQKLLYSQINNSNNKATTANQASGSTTNSSAISNNANNKTHSLDSSLI